MFRDRITPVAALALLVFGCSHAQQQVKPTPAPAVKAEPAAPAPAATVEPRPETAVPLPSLAAIHFDFDQSLLRHEDLTILNAVGDYLLKVATSTLTIAGHCDERGTVEYNIALGDRRAQATKDYLQRLGIDAARLKTISYGEAKPIDPGHDESAWAKNRRAEFQVEERQRAAK